MWRTHTATHITGTHRHPALRQTGRSLVGWVLRIGPTSRSGRWFDWYAGMGRGVCVDTMLKHLVGERKSHRMRNDTRSNFVGSSEQWSHREPSGVGARTLITSQV